MTRIRCICPCCGQEAIVNKARYDLMLSFAHQIGKEVEELEVLSDGEEDEENYTDEEMAYIKESMEWFEE